MNGRICTAVLRRFCRDDSGQDLIEYGLLVSLVVGGRHLGDVASRDDDPERVLERHRRRRFHDVDGGARHRGRRGCDGD